MPSGPDSLPPGLGHKMGQPKGNGEAGSARYGVGKQYWLVSLASNLQRVGDYLRRSVSRDHNGSLESGAIISVVFGWLVPPRLRRVFS